MNVFNHCSAYFADVVWTGLSTQHIKESLEDNISLERLRKVWDALNPAHYMDKFAALAAKKSLFIYTRYDTTFLPEFSKVAVDHIRERGAGSSRGGAAVRALHHGRNAVQVY